MRRIVVVGGGFAGVWAALAASATARRRAAGRDIAVTVVSRDPWLTVRPRLYEDDISDARVPLAEVLQPAGIELVQANVVDIDTGRRSIMTAGDGADDPYAIRYDRLVLAPGSALHRAAIPGAGQAHSVDTYPDATALSAHLESLPHRARAGDPPGRYTVVVVGAGFTGVEVATALATRVRRIAAGAGAPGLARVVVVEREERVAPDLSPGARLHVAQALASLRVESRTGVAVRAIRSDGVVLDDGEWIPAATVVCTGGFHASPLAGRLPVERDAFGRVPVDELLRVRGVDDVYAAGDVAHALADRDTGIVAPMSCQLAIPMGEIAGANAASDLLGLSPTAFAYPAYVTCLDLGDAGAIFMEGWGREVRLTGFWAKQLKESINTRLIYPPRPGHGSCPGLRAA